MWSHVETAPPDPIFGLAMRYREDQDADKVDLGIGAYRDEDGKPYVLQVVQKVEDELANAKLDKEYLSIDGLAGFREESGKLLLGADATSLQEKRVAVAQTLSGTGALRLAVDFYARFLPDKTNTPAYISKPTWANHRNVFTFAGFKDVREYRYFDAKTKGVDFEAMREDLLNAPNGAIVILQTCAHNPTGADPTKEQWKELAELCKQKKFVVLMDSAYQGYATGDLANDAYAPRLFDTEGVPFSCATSYSKNFGLYAERVGCLTVVTSSAKEAVAVLSQLKLIIRAQYSNPPCHGARIVHRILSDGGLRKEWEVELKGMSDRITRMRQLLLDELVRLKVAGNWEHVVKQIGMFSYTGLTPEQCETLITKHHIYLLSNGRISIAGLSARTVPKLAAAILDVVGTEDSAHL